MIYKKLSVKNYITYNFFLSLCPMNDTFNHLQLINNYFKFFISKNLSHIWQFTFKCDNFK